MAFPLDVTAVLTGATPAQLYSWNRTGLLVPEEDTRPYLYSFRDLVALRTVVHLRRETSLQKVRRAYASLQRLDLTEHPSRYTLVATGDSIALVDGDEAVDLVKQPGNQILATVADIFGRFENKAGRRVVDFQRPRRRLEVREHRIGGWPTVAGTRVPYDAVADLLSDRRVRATDIPRYFPTVTPAAARDAASFAREVAEMRPAA